MFLYRVSLLLSLVTCALFPHLFPAGLYSTAVNWVIKYFYIRACAGGHSRITTVITGQTFCREGQACRTDFCLPLKYFITSKWKIVHPIQTYLRVIRGGLSDAVLTNMSRVEFNSSVSCWDGQVYLFSSLMLETETWFIASNEWDGVKVTGCVVN